MWLHREGLGLRAGDAQDPHSPSPLAPERPSPQRPSRSCPPVRVGGEAPDPLLLNRGQAASNRRAPACLPPSFLPPDVLPNYPAAALEGRWRSRLPEKGRGERERAERRAGEGGGGAATRCHGHPGAPEPVHARAGLAEAQAAGGAAGGGRRSRGRSGRQAELGVGGRAPASGRASSGSTSICCGRACLKPADGSTDGSLGGRTGR